MTGSPRRSDGAAALARAHHAAIHRLLADRLSWRAILRHIAPGSHLEPERLRRAYARISQPPALRSTSLDRAVALQDALAGAASRVAIAQAVIDAIYAHVDNLDARFGMPPGSARALLRQRLTPRREFAGA